MTRRTVKPEQRERVEAGQSRTPTSSPPRPPTTIILAAGRGSRLAPLTDSIPKPLIEVGDQPLIERQVMALVSAGVRKIVVNLSHLGSMIEDFLGNGDAYGVPIEYSHEAQPLETGGALVFARDKIGNGVFWLHNGDIFTDFKYNGLPTHLPTGTDIHLVLTPTPSYREHGDFNFAHGRVTARGDDYVYCGIAAVNSKLIAGREQGTFSFRDLMFECLAQGRLSAQVFTGLWVDIGNPEQLAQARQLAT